MTTYRCSQCLAPFSSESAVEYHILSKAGCFSYQHLARKVGARG
jgi:hypothetical protein